jgi:hypothetical protein
MLLLLLGAGRSIRVATGRLGREIAIVPGAMKAAVKVT